MHSRSTKSLPLLTILSALVSAGLYWWWARLTASTFAQCVGGTPPAGMDCTHSLPIAGAIGFAVLAVGLLVAAVVRSLRSRRASAA